MSELDAERAAEEFAEMLLPFAPDTRASLIVHVMETLEDRLVTSTTVKGELRQCGLEGMQRTATSVWDCINGWFRGSKAWKP